MIFSQLPGVDWGLEITDAKLNLLSNHEVKKIGRALVENLLIVIRNQSLTPLEETNFCKQIGLLESMTERSFHRCPTQDGDIVQEIIQVTGRVNDKKQSSGLFGHNSELNWHTNKASATGIRKPIVWLYGVEDTEGSKTSWLNLQKAYSSFDIKTKERLRKLKGFFGFKHNKYTESKDFKEHVNPTPIPLVKYNNFTKKEGLYFPFLQLLGIEGMSEVQFKDFVEEMKELILKDEFLYTHEWMDGDVILSEQDFTIHKRWSCDVSKRLLHRITFDYSFL